MHADDPVNWRSLDPSLLARARREQRPIFVTVGYFSCYWCHVMQRESFLDAEVAARLNREFVPVVVDRELEPALDGLLQEFARRTLGHGGWPMNVFLTPDGTPFFATAYQPRDRFDAILERVTDAWREDRATTLAAAREALALLARPPVTLSPSLDAARGPRLRSLFLGEALSRADMFDGGFGDQAKFPHAPQLLALLEAEQVAPDGARTEFLRITLGRIASQGLRDHLGGGFFRYTADPQWQVPHFEKMLYDNAQLARVFLLAAEVYGEPNYRDIAFETLDFALHELALGDGSFASSLAAADDQGVEGGYYLWAEETLDKLLDGRERAVAGALLGLDGPPLLDGGRLPLPAADPRTAAAAAGIDTKRLDASLAVVRGKLLAARVARGLPRDDKALAAWNGLLLEAFAMAARAPGGQRFRAPGSALRDWLATTAWRDGRLSRLVQGETRLAGQLEDYAHVAAGLLAWSAASGQAEDMALAAAVADAAYVSFFTRAGWLTGEWSLLPIELREPAVADGALPSPSARLARVALELHARDDLAGWRARGLTALNVADDALMAAPFGHATHITAMVWASRSK